MDKFCPRLTQNIKKPVPCQKHACEFYTHVIGKDAQTGKDIDEWACVDIIQMRLTINLTQKMLQSTASVDKVNNTIAGLSPPKVPKLN